MGEMVVEWAVLPPRTVSAPAVLNWRVRGGWGRYEGRT